MKLKYVGPKPIISHTGILFDNNKEDKFVYLNIIIQLLKSLNHEYIENRVYTYEANTSRLNNDELFEELKKFCPKIEDMSKDREHLQEAAEAYQYIAKKEGWIIIDCVKDDKLLSIEEIHNKITHDIERAKDNDILTQEDKTVLINNIKIMKDYSIQRVINKTIYYCAVDELAELVKKDNLDYIIVPMFQKFAHVLHSVQGSLLKQKFPIDTKMDIYEEDGKLLAKLKVINKI